MEKKNHFLPACKSKQLVIMVPAVTINAGLLSPVMGAETKPLAAILNEKIETEDRILVLEKVVLGLPSEPVRREPRPFFADEDARIRNVKWEEGRSEKHQAGPARVAVGFDRKTAPTELFLIFPGQDISRFGAHRAVGGKGQVKNIPNKPTGRCRVPEDCPPGTETHICPIPLLIQERVNR